MLSKMLCGFLRALTFFNLFKDIRSEMSICNGKLNTGDEARLGMYVDHEADKESTKKPGESDLRESCHVFSFLQDQLFLMDQI